MAAPGVRSVEVGDYSQQECVDAVGPLSPGSAAGGASIVTSYDQEIEGVC